MNEREIVNELNKKETTISFKSPSDFEEFQTILAANTEWIDVNSDMEFMKGKLGMTQALNSYSSPVQWDENCSLGGLLAVFGPTSGGLNSSAVVNTQTAPLTINERGGVKCKLASEYLDKDMDSYARLVTEGVHHFKSNMKMLVRGGQVMALHSAKYNPLPQDAIFEIAKQYMIMNFPGYSFKGASYNHDATEVAYSICNGNDVFLKEYANDWIDAGLPPRLLEKTNPALIFSTSDTARFPLCIKPRLYIGSTQYPLGTDIDIKHTGNAFIADMNSYIDQAYAKVGEGIDSVRSMLTKEITHPYAAFVKVCHKVGLTKKIKTCMQEALMNFKDEYGEEDKVTAFNIFKAICDVQLYPCFTALSPMTQMASKECIYRIHLINWDDVDKAGSEVI